MSGRNVDSRVAGTETDNSEANNGPQQEHTSWYENIHFKAQYHHLRTSNYAAVVKSAHSLDKVSTLPTVTVTSPQAQPKAHHQHHYVSCSTSIPPCPYTDSSFIQHFFHHN